MVPLAGLRAAMAPRRPTTGAAAARTPGMASHRAASSGGHTAPMRLLAAAAPAGVCSRLESVASAAALLAWTHSHGARDRHSPARYQTTGGVCRAIALGAAILQPAGLLTVIFQPAKLLNNVWFTAMPLGTAILESAKQLKNEWEAHSHRTRDPNPRDPNPRDPSPRAHKTGEQRVMEAAQGRPPQRLTAGWDMLVDMWSSTVSCASGAAGSAASTASASAALLHWRAGGPFARGGGCGAPVGAAPPFLRRKEVGPGPTGFCAEPWPVCGCWRRPGPEGPGDGWCMASP